jgi:hypothetical protein
MIRIVFMARVEHPSWARRRHAHGRRMTPVRIHPEADLRTEEMVAALAFDDRNQKEAHHNERANRG